MAHMTGRLGYQQLTERLNRFPQGAPPSHLLFKILSILFSEQEAALVAQVPIKPFTAQKAGKIWKMDLTSARHVLNKLASRALLLDVVKNGVTVYTLPPPMAGFFEFSLMRVRQDVDQKMLAQLFYEYLNVEEDFIKTLFTDGETQLGRIFVHEPALSDQNALHVLDYERASEVIGSASHRAVSQCYCRHKMQHMERACAAPMEICMTFNGVADSLVRHGFARQMDRAEAMDLLQVAYQNNLVQFGENVRTKLGFICNCCGCCCEALIAQRRFASLHPVHTTNFLPEISETLCNGCGKCVDVCPVAAMTLISANHPHHPHRKKARLDEDICLGCGICVRSCPSGAIQLKSRPTRVITPVNSAHRAVVMAIERGKLQHLIFDNRALWSHRAMAAILGVILRLPPSRQILASRQVKSRYLEYLISHIRI